MRTLSHNASARCWWMAALCLFGAAAGAQTLTVANFGGANAKAQQAAFYTPFEATRKNVKVRGVEYSGDLAQIASLHQSGKPGQPPSPHASARGWRQRTRPCD